MIAAKEMMNKKAAKEALAKWLAAGQAEGLESWGVWEVGGAVFNILV